MKNIKFAMAAMVALMMWSCGAPGEWENAVLESPAFAEESLVTRSAPPPPSLPPFSLFEAPDVESSMEIVAERSAAARAETFISSSAAMVNPADTTRKLIRTANIRFRTKDVIQTTFAIEDLVIRRNGFVENTTLESRVNRTREIPIQRDSAILVTHYTVFNRLVLRVPSTELDATLREIAQFVQFMHSRTINAQDVTFDLLATRLEQERLARFNTRMTRAIDNRGRALSDVSAAENLVLQRETQADQAKIANLRVLDRVDFSTITLSIYQNQSIMYETIAREKTIRPFVYTTPFGTRFVDALKFGWGIVVEFFLLLVNIWSVLVVAVLVFFGVRYFRKKFKKKKNA